MKKKHTFLSALVLLLICIAAQLSGQISPKPDCLIRKGSTPQKLNVNNIKGSRFSKEKLNANKYQLLKDFNEVSNIVNPVFKSTISTDKYPDNYISQSGSKNYIRNAGKMQTSELSNSTAENTSSSSTNSSPLDAMKGKRELLEKRDAYSKHFKNSDGSYTAIIDAVPMHYERNGKFLDIDHSVVANSSIKYPFANTTNLFESYFGSNSKGGIKIKSAGGEVEEFLNTRMYWEVKGQEIGSVESSNTQIKVKGDKAYYNNLYGDISAEFTILTGRRKLDYVIPNKNALGDIPANADFLVFTEEVILPDGWKHTLTERGIAILDKNNKQIYLYESPTSSDATNELSREKNTFFETNIKENILTIRTKVKTRWILDNNRRFPIKIDPTATAPLNFWISIYDDGVEETGGKFFGRVSGFWLNTFVKYDTSSIPSGSTVNNANTTTGSIRVNSVNGTTNNLNSVMMTNCADPTTNTGLVLYNSATTALTNSFVNKTTGIKTVTFTLAGRNYIQAGLGTSVNLSIYGGGTYNATNYYGLGTAGNYPQLTIVYTPPPACSGTPTGGTTVLTPNTGTYGSTFTATVTGSTVATGLTYQWQLAPSSSGPWTDIAGETGASANLTAPNVLTTLYARRKITCGANSNFSTAAPYIITCTPSHTSGNCAAPGDCGYVGISNVSIGTINNTTAYSNPAPAYNYYSALSTNISQNNSYPLSITYRDKVGNLGKIGAWIDWNNDGDFEDANEFIGSLGGVPANSIVTANVVVPIGVAPGTKRLRVRSVFNGEILTSIDACTSKQYGETEDYNVNVVVVLDCVPTSWDPDGLYIESVKFVGTLSDPPVNPSSYSANGFQNFTALPSKAVQAQGEGINIIARASSAGSVFARGTWKAWVDWNNDGIFDQNPATEEVYNIYGYVGSEANFGFVIPPSTPPGNYRIRIRVNNSILYTNDPPEPAAYETGGFNFSPCDPFTEYASYNNNIDDYGETEDYLFTVEAKCNSVITAVTDGQNCGPGTVTLGATATGTPAVTEFRWYTTKTGGSYTTSPVSGSSTTFTTPSISVTTKYYVTAFNGCESQERTLVTAKINPTPIVTFLQTAPTICGEAAIMQLTAVGDKEVVYEINENFESGTLGVFENINSDGNSAQVDANTSWKNQISTFVPDTNIWVPAISSGFGDNKFALAYSDSKKPNPATTTVENSITLKKSVDISSYLNLYLKLDLYYSRKLPDGNISEDEYVKIELSTDGGITYPYEIDSFIEGVGTSTRFKEFEPYDLSSYISPGATNIKIRIRHRSWAATGQGFLADGVAVDNIQLFGDKPLPTSFMYDTTAIDGYTNIACTVPYVSGTPVTTIYLKPSDTQLENNPTFTVPVSATLKNGCSAASSIDINNDSKIWNTASTNWNTTNWKPDPAVPDATKCVIVKKPVTLGSATNGAALNLTVQDAGNLQIAGNLRVTDYIKNTTGIADRLTVKSDANLIQINEGVAINTGDITAKRTLNLSSGRQQYNYMISPLEGQSLKDVYNNAGTTVPFVLYHREDTNNFYNSSGAYIKGRGLAVKEPATSFLPTAINTTFTGKPTNGAFTYPLVRSAGGDPEDRGFNLVGNPYPSNIDLIKLFAENDGTGGNLDSSFYFWDNNANSQTAQAGNNYDGVAYGIFNAQDGTGIPATGDPGKVTTKTPTRYVKAGQGFMARSKIASANLIFNNTMRTKEGTTSFFGKMSDSTETAVDRFWLNMISPANLASTIAIVYFPEGNNAFTQDDSRSLGGSDAVYSMVENEKVVINGRSTFVDTDRIPLGTSHFVTGNYTIGLAAKEGIFDGPQNIYLKDLQTGTITNLSAGNYTFDANAGESTGRFEIIYKPETILVTDNPAKDQIVVYRDGNDFVIRSPKDLSLVELYDSSGKLITTLKTNGTKAVVDGSSLPNAAYVLKITTKDGGVVTRKILR